MKMEKTWLSYPLWLLYASVTGAFAVGCLIWVCGCAGAGHWPAWAAAGLLFAGTAGIWFAGRWMAGRIALGAVSRQFTNVAEIWLALCLYAAAVIWRLHLVSVCDGNLGGSAFYEMASVKADVGVPWIDHGISRLYTTFLAFVLSFTGNKPEAAVMLQLVIQAAAMLLFYFAVRSLAGRGEACCALAVMAFAPDIAGQIFGLTPEPLYFLLYVSGLLLCGIFGRVLRQEDAAGGSSGKRKKYALSVLCGLYIGFLAFLDMLGWTLLLPAAGICIQEGRKGKNGGNGQAKEGPLRLFSVCLAGAVASAALLLVREGIHSGKPFREALGIWLSYPAGGFSLPESVGAAPEMDFFAFSYGNLLVCLCGLPGIIGFWFRKTQKQDVWILLFLLLLTLRIFGMETMGDKSFFVSVWGVLAGIGICSMGREEGCSRRPEEAEEGSGTEAEEGKVPLPAGNALEETESGLTEGEDAPEEEGNGDAQEGKPNIKWIENPLPLPKKHVKREMSYRKDVPGDDMEFDITVGEDDDFDI